MQGLLRKNIRVRSMAGTMVQRAFNVDDWRKSQQINMFAAINKP